MIAAVKGKKKLPQRCRRKFAFQTIAIELYKQLKKTNITLIIVFIGVGVFAKLVDEFYILIKIYSYISFVFSVASKKVEYGCSNVAKIFKKSLHFLRKNYV